MAQIGGPGGIIWGDDEQGSSDADYPAASDVRLGVVYGGGSFTGTLIVPPASKVLAGYEFDNGTLGTLDQISVELRLTLQNDEISITVE